MKVLMIDGSSEKNTAVYAGMQECASVLKKYEIESDIVRLQENEVHPCTACGKCIKRRICIFEDTVNVCIKNADAYDALIAGGEILYGEPCEEIQNFLTRLMNCASDHFYMKPGAILLSAGENFEQNHSHKLEEQLANGEMMVLTSHIGFQLYGSTEDKETAEKLGRRMAYVLRCQSAGENSGIEKPEEELKVISDYMR
jgi:multimeric flavodoxin WrbA